MSFFRLVNLLFLVGIFAQAGEIQRIGPQKGFVTISSETPGEFDVNDYVCLTRDRRAVACGQVIRPLEKALLLAISGQSQGLQVGQLVEINKMKNAPAGRSETLEIVQAAPDPAFENKNLGLGINLGFIQVHFSQALTPNFALGLLLRTGSAGAGSGTISGYGLGGTVSYHYNGPYKTGPWGSSGLVIDLLTATKDTQTEKTGSMLLYGVGGYRYSFENSISVAGGFGLQFYLNGNLTTTFDLQFSGILPAIVLEAGYTF